MTVNSATSTASYLGNGTTTVFPVPFYFLVNTDLKVSKKVAATGVTSVLTLNSDYTLSGAGNNLGGTLTATVAPAPGDQLYVERNVDAVQQTAYPENNKFPSASHEKALDRLTMLIQQSLSKLGFGLFRDPLGNTYDLGNNTLVNSATAVNPTDVPNLQQVQTAIVGGAAPILVGPGGSSTVGFLQAGTGAIPRTVQDKLRESVSVKDFGAIGDGVANDTAAIQAAINYAAQFATDVGFDVVFPNGKYLFSALTISTSAVRLVGQGTAYLIKSGSTGDGISIVGASGRIYAVELRNLRFGSAVTGVSGRMIYIQNGGQFKLSNIIIGNYPARPYRGLETYNVSQITIDTMTVQNCVNVGVRITDTVDIYVTNSRSDANGSHGWNFDWCGGVYFTNATAFNNGGSGYLMTRSVTPIITSNNSYYHMTNCIADTSGSHNWNIAAVEQSVFTNCWGSTQNNATADLHGFAVDGLCKYIEFNNCLALTNNGTGMLVSSGAANININHGIYLSNGRVASSGFRAGITWNGAGGQIIGADCTDNQSPKMQTYGLYVNGGTILSVTDCNFYGNLTAPYLVAAFPTTAFIERGNLLDQSTSVASANIVTLPNFGDLFFISGTTTINGIVNQYAGRRVTLVFGAALTLVDTGSMKLAGNLVSTAGSTISLVSDGSNWYETSRSVN